MEESRRSLSRPLIAVLVVVFVALVGALLYFTVLRVQASDYDAASEQIDLMVAKATEFEALNNNNALSPGTVTKLQLANATQIMAAYNAALDELQASPAVTRDDTVAKAYADVQQTVVEYGQTSDDFIVTLTALSTIKQACNTLLQQLSSITSLAKLEATDADCKDALASYASVPLDEFNKNYFLAYHENVNNLVGALETYYTAAESGATTQKQKAQEVITSSINTINTLNKSDDTPSIANSKSPVDGLKKLQAVIKKQRS